MCHLTLRLHLLLYLMLTGNMEWNIVHSLIGFISGIVLTFIVLYLYFNGKLQINKERISHLSHTNELLSGELDQEKNFHLDTRERLLEMNSQYTKLQSDYEHLSNRYNELIEDENTQHEKFEYLASRILKKQSSSFTEEQKLRMEELLSPLRSQIETFQKNIEKTNLDSTERIATLKEQIKNLSERTDQVSKDANNLARALKGDYKKQGNWGEIILESILEKSGLEKDREYFTQNSLIDDDGKVKRPDVIIKLPEGKHLIVDSKVSLSAYDQIISAESDEDARQHQKAHVLAIKNHVDGLANKNYHDLYKMESPDFVLMFIPIDTAFSTALHAEPGLYTYAFEKNIVIVTSSTLLATLKTIDTMWKNEKYNRNALQIAEEAGKMYDKFDTFLESMKRMGKQLNTVQNSYHLAMKQLSTGSGNLIGKARKVQRLGAKASKQIDYKGLGYYEEE